MDRLLIQGLRARTILGIQEAERAYPQEVWIDLVLFVDIRAAARADDLSLSVDYAEVAHAVSALVEGGQRHTVEALAEDIATLCLQRPGVQKVTVRIRKPHAVRGAAAVGVEIERPAP